MDKDKAKQDEASAKKEDKAPEVIEKKAPEVPAPKAEEKKPEIAPNGAVLLDNPIPHPARKTEHKNMEYDINVDDSSLHYDINISDNDDFDV